MQDYTIKNKPVENQIIFPNQKGNSAKSNSYKQIEKTEAALPAEAARAYALAKPSFGAVTKLNDISLILTDNKDDPRICVEILNNDKLDAKPAICSVYEIALHDQLYNDLRRNSYIKEKDSYVRDYKRRFDVSCPQENLVDLLKLIDNRFVNVDIEKRYIDSAKKLAPVGYKLHTLGVDTSYDYNDVPKGTTEDTYQDLINQIKYEDVQKYNDDILKNSDTRVTLSVNKDFYNDHKDKIMPLLNKMSERIY